MAQETSSFPVTGVDISKVTLDAGCCRGRMPKPTVRQRFEGAVNVQRAIAGRVDFYSRRRPHRVFNLKTPSQALALLA